jgi:AcrR family transcriptional regulator
VENGRAEPPAARGESRDRLLRGAIDYVAEHGIGDLTLRSLASKLGTSHRMLIHHFGSKHGLLVAIVKEVEERERATLSELLDETASGATAPSREAAWAWWEHISDPALWPNERLFFELYAQALHGRAHAIPVLEGVVESWVDQAAAPLIEAGAPSGAARAQARLGVAVTRGLLLDLLATGDRSGVDDAMRLFIDIQLAAWQQLTGTETAGGRSKKSTRRSG